MVVFHSSSSIDGTNWRETWDRFVFQMVKLSVPIQDWGEIKD